MYVRLGNAAVLEPHPDGPPSALAGLRVTFVSLPEPVTLAEALRTITDPRGVWHSHSASPPIWVESDNPTLEVVLAEHFACPAGAPDDVESTHWTASGPPGVGPDTPPEAVAAAQERAGARSAEVLADGASADEAASAYEEALLAELGALPPAAPRKKGARK